MKYSVPNHSEKLAEDRKKKTLSANGGASVYIYDDGTVEAEGFKDISKGGVDYEVDHETGTVSFIEKTNDNLLVKYTPASVKKVYEVISKKVYSLKDVFAKIAGKVKSYSVKNLQRYKHSSKTLKDGIDKHLKAGKTFVFSTDHYAGRYIKPHIQSTTFGPYEKNVVLAVEEDINFISDLLVVKTGLAGAGNDSIVYISPHKVLTSTGYHTSVGVNYQGNTLITTGQNLDAGINATTKLHRLTSKGYIIKKGTVLKSTTPVEGSYYYMADGSANQAGQPHLDPFPVHESNAQAYFTKYSNKMQNSGWDGVIPAGAYFSIECWSTNDKYIGYAGEISVVPVDETVKVNLNGECSATGQGATYEEAKQDADKKSDNLMYKKINNALMKLGLKKKNTNALRYERMILRSAQNVYDKGALQLGKDKEVQSAVNSNNQDFIHIKNTEGSKASKSSSSSSATASTSSSSGGSSGSSSSGGGY